MKRWKSRQKYESYWVHPVLLPWPPNIFVYRAISKFLAVSLYCHVRCISYCTEYGVFLNHSPLYHVWCLTQRCAPHIDFSFGSRSAYLLPWSLFLDVAGILRRAGKLTLIAIARRDTSSVGCTSCGVELINCALPYGYIDCHDCICMPRIELVTLGLRFEFVT